MSHGERSFQGKEPYLPDLHIQCMGLHWDGAFMNNEQNKFILWRNRLLQLDEMKISLLIEKHGDKSWIFSFEMIIVNNNYLINAWAYTHKFYLLHAFFLIWQIKLWSQWKQRKRHVKILNLIYLTCLHNVRSHRITDTAVTRSSFENVIYSLLLGFGAGLKASRFIL